MIDRKLNVLLLIPNLGSGGAQRIFHQHRLFLSRDFNVISCVFNFDGAFDNERDQDIISLDVPAGRNIVGKMVNFFRRVRRLKNLKAKHNIDVSISHLEGADYVNILSRKKDRLILWIHGTKLYDQEISGVIGSFRKGMMIPMLYRRADKIVCVSNGIADELRKFIPATSDKITTVLNGIDLASIDSLSKEPLTQEWQSLLTKNFVVVTHCRFAPQKNLRALMHVVAGMKDLENVKFVLLGDGEQRDELIDLAKRLGIPAYHAWTNDPLRESDLVFFAGRQSNPFPWLRHSGLYILTSLWEGFPLSICEAIACGLPIVAADCPTGPREILDISSAGVLMPLIHEDSPASIEQWTETLRSLINDSPKLDSLRANARQNAHRFSSDNSKLETIAVVKDVMR